MESLKEQSKLLAGLGRDLLPPGGLRNRLDTVHGLLEQEYRGNITIGPNFRLRQFRQMITNPSLQATRDMILAGERATWPKLSMILHQTRISQTLDAAVRQVQGAARQAGDAGVQRRQLKTG